MLHKLERELTEQGVILGIFIVPGCPKNNGFLQNIPECLAVRVSPQKHGFYRNSSDEMKAGCPSYKGCSEY